MSKYAINVVGWKKYIHMYRNRKCYRCGREVYINSVSIDEMGIIRVVTFLECPRHGIIVGDERHKRLVELGLGE